MEEELRVYHGTSVEKLQSILIEGVRPPSFWSYKHQATLTYAGIEEMRGYGGAVIAVRIRNHHWHDVDKQNFDFLPIDGAADEAYYIMENNGIGIVCLDHISPADLEVIYVTEPDERKSRRKFKHL